MMTFIEALEHAETWVDRIEGVEGVAEGLVDGRPCITVFVSSAQARRALPVVVGRWPVVVEGMEPGPRR